MAEIPKSKNKGGRPKKPIDYETVEKLASLFCTQKEIAAFLNCSLSHLVHDEQFLLIFEKGIESAKTSLRRNQFKIAETSAAMAIFLGKNYLDQRDDRGQYNSNYETVDFNFTVVNEEADKS